jgi:dinuclear metal center YbgI/SA1388 family protein
VVRVKELIDYCSTTLESARFLDPSLNGLQVAGGDAIQRVASAVSVNERVIREAIDWRADLLLVHHGLFWGERSRPIAGPLRIRLQLLLEADVNLVAYHLPLDAHPTLGNNALLAAALDLSLEQPFADVNGRSIGYIASAPNRVRLDELALDVEQLTGHKPIVLAGGPSSVHRVGIVSGSGYSALDEAAALGCEALVTGDVREPTMALARELGISVIAGGHEATERLGVQALTTALVERFDIETRFFSDPNPI